MKPSFPEPDSWTARTCASERFALTSKSYFRVPVIQAQSRKVPLISYEGDRGPKKQMVLCLQIVGGSERRMFRSRR